MDIGEKVDVSFLDSYAETQWEVRDRLPCCPRGRSKLTRYGTVE